MNESRRRAYLDALGLQVWAIKPLEPELNRLLLQPGRGGTLLICDTQDATATRFAGDVARALAGDVVWAWPDPEGGPQSRSLPEVIDLQLFTRVVVFGAALAQQIFNASVPPVVGSASITITDGLDVLVVRGSARKSLWKQLSGAGIH